MGTKGTVVVQPLPPQPPFPHPEEVLLSQHSVVGKKESMGNSNFSKKEQGSFPQDALTHSFVGMQKS